MFGGNQSDMVRYRSGEWQPFPQNPPCTSDMVLRMLLLLYRVIRIIIRTYLPSESNDGTIRRINYSQPQRDSHMAVPIDQVEKWYHALKKFYDLATDERYLIEFKLKPGNNPQAFGTFITLHEKKKINVFIGEMITFDNLRVLHGRTAFGENLKGERHVQGAYLDWDEARSRIRVLKTKILDNQV